jgi:hypothetical protein
MVKTAERKTMGRPRGTGKSTRDDVAVKLDRVVVGKARAVATHKGVPLAEVLTELLKGPVDKAYLAVIKELGDAKD